jgi:hypothetical protein
MTRRPTNSALTRGDQEASSKGPRRKLLRAFLPILLMLGGMYPEQLVGQENTSGRGLPVAPAQTTQVVEGQIVELREEIRQLRQEVSELKVQLQLQASATAAASRAPVKPSAPPSATTSPSPQSPEELADSVSMLQTQIAEQAQTKVESNSKMPVKIFGTMLFNTFYNTRGVDWWDVPSVVSSPRDYSSSTGSLSASLRQSRIGVLVDGPTVGSFRSSASVAVDFLGGESDFQSSPLFGVPRLYYGYVRFQSAKTALEAGQDAMILAPGNPTSLSAFAYPELYRAGNLYTQAPQIRVEQNLASTQRGSLQLAVGMVAPVGTYPNLDYPGASQYEAWQRPAIQGRLFWLSKGKQVDPDQGWELGLSGHYGRARLGETSAASWATAFDLNGHLQRWGVAAEGYLGQNLQSFGGGIGQPGKTRGGFLEGRYQATSQLQFDGGFGTDHLTKLDIIPVSLNRNTGVYANTIFKFTPEVALSFEYRHMVTRPFRGQLWKNENLNLALAYSF